MAPILVSACTVALLLTLFWYVGQKDFEDDQKARGLLKYKGKWGTPEQVEEWKMTNQGLVRFKDSWVTPEERSRLEKFEQEQLAKGLVEYKGKWGTPKEVERWKQEDFERKQLAKGLIKHKGRWVTPREKFELEQIEKGLVKFVDRKCREIWGTPQQVEEWKRIELGLRNNFADYAPREFEKFIAGLFQKMGYKVSLGPYVGDYGVDVIAQKDDRRILIQIKKYARGHLVGNREVRDALGAIWGKADKAIFVTTSDFTEQAYEQARDAPIELWNHRTLKNFTERYFIGTTEEKAQQKTEDAEDETQEKTIDVYKEAFPELSEEEAELQETQEFDMDFEDDEEDPENDVPHRSIILTSCKHENVARSFSTVGGEPRRVVTKCLDCGKVLKTDRISR
jgi:hypothetical protein